MPVCLHRGCETEFDEQNNKEGDCNYHPGAPIFHEGLKGWQCCSKRVTDFDEFLKIPGCMTGKHTIEADPVPQKEQPNQTSTSGITAPSSITKDGVETYGDLSKIPNVPVPSSQQHHETTIPSSISTPASFQQVKDVPIPEDEPGVVVPSGTTCKRNACEITYTDESIRDSPCTHHPGQPIFHEGSKGWSCCSRKVLEFEEFLKIKGCTQGKHMFIGPRSNDDVELVDVRNDFYQTQTHVIVSFFAKKIDKEKSKITFSKNKLDLDLYFSRPTPNGPKPARCIATKDLFQPIDPSQSVFNIMTTKVEIKLAKANGISWPALTVQEAMSGNHGMVTFGVTGGAGTVGAKEAYIQTDSPLYATRSN